MANDYLLFAAIKILYLSNKISRGFKAIEILKDLGCEEVYIFGSLVEGPVTSNSDIDLAVKGIPPGFYIKVLAKLIMQLDHPVDLISLEEDNRFGNMLKREGYLRRVN